MEINLWYPHAHTNSQSCCCRRCRRCGRPLRDCASLPPPSKLHSLFTYPSSNTITRPAPKQCWRSSKEENAGGYPTRERKSYWTHFSGNGRWYVCACMYVCVCRCVSAHSTHTASTAAHITHTCVYISYNIIRITVFLSRVVITNDMLVLVSRVVFWRTAKEYDMCIIYVLCV